MIVPTKLTEELTEAAEKWGGDPHSMYYGMAVRVIRFYLGDEWVERKIILQEQPDPFMLNEFDERSENRFIHMTRVALLGDFLFRLRSSRNFEVLLKRLTDRPTKPCFYELEIANIFHEKGFSIEIVKETGTRGQDFDFIARTDGDQINVEVTAKEDVPMGDSTIKNTLFDKRNQLPNDNPAILYVIIPTAWTDDGPLIEDLARKSIEDFFTRSRRISVVVFYWERAFKIGEGRLMTSVFRHYVHPNPRHPVSDLSFLTPLETLHDPHTLQNTLDTHPDQTMLKKELAQRAWVPSFVQYVEKS